MDLIHAQKDFEIIVLKSGVKSLRSLEHGETFHPVTGPRIEAQILHIGQSRLLERCLKANEFVIWDVGFGAAANVVTAIETIRDTRAKIQIRSFDKTTAPIEFAMAHSDELQYIVPHLNLLKSLLKNGEVQVTPNLHWKLHLGDFKEQVKKQELPAPNAIFYDPYSCTGNPEMWTLDHFRSVRNRMSTDVPCLLTNYTRSTAVRVTLLLAGFFVGRGREVGEKAETTVASNHLSLLEHPLDLTWLERVRNSTNSAPFRSAVYSKARISDLDLERVRQSPQFSKL